MSWYDCIMHDNAKTQNTDILAYREGQLEQCEVLPCLLDLIVVVERNRVVQVEQVVAVCGGAYDTRGSQSERWVSARPCVSCGWAHRSISIAFSYALQALSKSSSRESVIARYIYDDGKSGLRLIEAEK